MPDGVVPRLYFNNGLYFAVNGKSGSIYYNNRQTPIYTPNDRIVDFDLSYDAALIAYIKQSEPGKIYLHNRKTHHTTAVFQSPKGKIERCSFIYKNQLACDISTVKFLHREISRLIVNPVTGSQKKAPLDGYYFQDYNFSKKSDIKCLVKDSRILVLSSSGTIKYIFPVQARAAVFSRSGQAITIINGDYSLIQWDFLKGTSSVYKPGEQIEYACTSDSGTELFCVYYDGAKTGIKTLRKNKTRLLI